jgi:hypothetical protein
VKIELLLACLTSARFRSFGRDYKCGKERVIVLCS